VNGKRKGKVAPLCLFLSRVGNMCCKPNAILKTF
jgi:hypothetical protein